MTAVVDIANRMMQRIGTRTTMTAAQLTALSTNEAIQFNLMYPELRDALLRMAPWNCAMKTANLTYITSQTGTPENTSPATTLWAPGQPPPPWAYEYQYPVDCLQPRWIIPATQTGFAGGIPITTAVTGGASAWWWGQPVRFKVQNDQFYPVTAAAVVAGGTGYAVGDIITLPIGPSTSPPIGAPAQLVVLVAAGGIVSSVGVVNQINGEATAQGGSYFAPQTGTIAQASTSGTGTGFTCTLTFGPQGDQRVILTNQEFATLILHRTGHRPQRLRPELPRCPLRRRRCPACHGPQGRQGLCEPTAPSGQCQNHASPRERWQRRPYHQRRDPGLASHPRRCLDRWNANWPVFWHGLGFDFPALLGWGNARADNPSQLQLR